MTNQSRGGTVTTTSGYESRGHEITRRISFVVVIRDRHARFGHGDVIAMQYVSHRGTFGYDDRTTSHVTIVRQRHEYHVTRTSPSGICLPRNDAEGSCTSNDATQRNVTSLSVNRTVKQIYAISDEISINQRYLVKIGR